MGRLSYNNDCDDYVFVSTFSLDCKCTLTEYGLNCLLFCFPPEGATELELNNIEAQLDCRLPDDYRCSYRIHNGQKLVIPGSVSI